MPLIEGAVFAPIIGSMSLDWLPSLADNILFACHIQSILVLTVLVFSWLWASQSRVRESQRIRGNPLAFAEPPPPCASHGTQRALPKVSVVLAVKGSVGEAGMANWRSQLVTMYGGAMEYIFSVESKHDPAYQAVRQLQREMRGAADVRLVVAGLSSNCSQQIHNQLAAARVACPRSKYLLLLDDDIQCHPGSIGALVSAMENGPDVFCCTGYSFDLPSTFNLAAYAAMAFRLPLQVGLASGGRVYTVWGGCIMIRLEDFRADRYGMASALAGNGYSNDLILTAIAVKHGLTIWSPATAIFPGRMSGSWTFRRYWNYVRRQTFALTTYCCAFAFRLNYFGLVWYSYSAFAVVLPLPASLVRVSALLSALVTAPAGGMASALSSAWSSQSTLALLNLSCVLASCLSGIRLFHAVVTLCNLLSPEKPPIRLGSISLLLSVCGMALNLTLLPVISIYTVMQPAISWAGITYMRRRGLIHDVTHPMHAARGEKATAHVQVGGNAAGEAVDACTVVEIGIAAGARGISTRTTAATQQSFAMGASRIGKVASTTSRPSHLLSSAELSCALAAASGDSAGGLLAGAGLKSSASAGDAPIPVGQWRGRDRERVLFGNRQDLEWSVFGSSKSKAAAEGMEAWGSSWAVQVEVLRRRLPLLVRSLSPTRG